MKHSFLRLDLLARPGVALMVGGCLLFLGRAACLAASNDDLAKAQVIPPGSSFSVNGNNFGATLEAFETAADYPVGTGHSVWYAWTPSVSGTLSGSINRGGELTANVAIFKGTMPSQASFLTSDLFLTIPTIHVEAGQEYRISIGNDSYPGSFNLSGSVTAGPPPFFTGQTALSNGIYYLAFPNGNYFGYYSFLSDAHYIYHFDLGYEYLFNADDGKNGLYMYDFASSTFFYTSPTFPFPYLYDFTLNTFLYYYPDPNNAGHYNTNGVRYFYNFATGKIITK